MGRGQRLLGNLHELSVGGWCAMLGSASVVSECAVVAHGSLCRRLKSAAVDLLGKNNHTHRWH